MKQSTALMIAALVVFGAYELASAAFPAPPPGLTYKTVVKKATYLPQVSAQIAIWHTADGAFYAHVKPLTADFRLDSMDWAISDNGSQCPSSFYVDEYGSAIQTTSVNRVFKLEFYCNPPYFPGHSIYLAWRGQDTPVYYAYPADFNPNVVVPPAPCLAPDADGDGVPDAWDNCPGTKPGRAVNKHGCPKGGAVIMMGN